MPLEYKLDGDVLTLPSAGAGVAAQALRVSFSADGLLRLSSWVEGRASVQELRRKGPVIEPDHLLLGEWLVPRPELGAGIEASQIFLADGKGLLIIPFKWEAGKYTAAGTSLRVEVARGVVLQGVFSIKDAVLTVRGPRGESKYARY